MAAIINGRAASAKGSAIGVRGRLFLAFAVIVALAMAASGFAVVSFIQLGGTVRTITTERLPPITAALQLAQATEKVVALGPALAGARDTAELASRSAQLADQSAKVSELLSRIEAMGVDRAEYEGVKKAIMELTTGLGSLEQNVSQRLSILDRSKGVVETVIKADGEIQKFISLLLNVNKSELEAALGGLFAGDAAVRKEAAGKVEQTQRTAEPLRTIQDEMRSVVSAIVEGSVITDLQRIDILSMRVALPIHAVKEQAKELDERQSAYIAQQLGIIETATAKETGIFALRQRELALAEEAKKVVETARVQTGELSTAVERLVTSQQDAVARASEASEKLVSGRTLLLVGLTLAIVLGAVLIVWFYVGPQVAGRIKTLETAMRRIAGGELETKIPEAGGDEIGAMAGALVVFRDNAIQIREANERALREQEEASEQRRRERLKIAEEFEAQVRGVVEAVSTSSTQLQSNADGLAATAADASQKTAAVAAVSEETTANVSTVATSAEQLSASIAEIARQVAESTKIAGQAVTEAERTNATVKGLADAAQKIGDVVKLISDIAGQTNLLALNATIEAARAGEAGKGFAVVAAEVKNLATQTAKATDEITAQINAIQSTTGSSVAAIAAIGTTINRVNEIANSIAAAVEEQGAATQEIARNVQEAARGTSEVSANVAGVAEAASKTGTSAGQVLEAAQHLSKQAETLRGAVDQFLGRIRVG
ncbi:MAG TPA: methyl-accepting chemotaxis protein [Alphaproteobacteria bacterium]|nr:methyl-accepting chemotaxis protein [Alphaproteobacteria bacterium]